MSIDCSDLRLPEQRNPKELQNTGNVSPNPGINAQSSRSLETALLTLIEENRRRDTQRDAMLETLIRRFDLNSNQ